MAKRKRQPIDDLIDALVWLARKRREASAKRAQRRQAKAAK
jgi:hypothetical protein